MEENKAKDIIILLLTYSEKYPRLRFWQILTTITGKNIYIGEDKESAVDTFYFDNLI